MRFVELAEKAFSPLGKAGFQLVQRSSARLQYESAQCAVAIEWDPLSGELEAYFGLPSSSEERTEMFSLSDIQTMQSEGALTPRMPVQVAREDLLGPFLERLADDTWAHASLALAGDRMFFRRLKTFRSAQSSVFMRDMELRRVRSAADNAWREQNLVDIIKLYTSIEGDLTLSEKKKLDYARKHVRP